MPPVVTVAIPVLRRPERARAVLDSLAHNTLPGVWEAVFALSPSDEAQWAACVAVQREYGPGLVGLLVMDEDYEGRGDYARKVNAVAGLRPGAPWVFTAADDLQFHYGWLSRALSYATTGIGVIGTNDQCNRRVMRGQHSTHSLVARWWIDQGAVIDEPGKVMHEGYPHECCDDELVQSAQARGAFVAATDAVVEHLHPTVGKAPWDPTYVGSTTRVERMEAGRNLLSTRRSLWS